LLATERNKIETKLNGVLNDGERLNASTSVIGREKIHHELHELRSQWDAITGEFGELHSKADSLSALDERYIDNVEKLSRALSEHEKVIDLSGSNFQNIGLIEKREHLRRIKVCSYN